MLTGREIRLGKIFGIEITVDYSWFWIFGLITWSFSIGFFPILEPGRSAILYWALGILASIFFFGSVIAHEVSHTLVARANKLPIEKITLFIFGGVSRLIREPSSPGVEIKMALAGPAMSVLIGMALFTLGYILSGITEISPISTLFQVIGSINFALAFFNLLPGFPLDGGRVLRGVLWRQFDDLPRATSIASYFGRGIAVLIILWGAWRIFSANFLGGVWLVFIGYFLYEAAVASYRQTLIFQALKSVTAVELAFWPPLSIDKSADIDEVNKFFIANSNEIVLVRDGQREVGLITSKEITPKTESISSAYRPLMKFPLVSARSAGDEVLSRVSESESGLVVVRDRDHDLGVVTLSSIGRFLEQHHK